MPQIVNSFSIGALYRLIMPQILSNVSKIIYLDADTIITLDINELWQFEIGDAPIAAVTEKANGVNSANNFVMCRQGLVEVENYFNSGVLVMNLELMRNFKDAIKESTVFVATKTECQHFDQDILNHCFSEKYFKLPLKFNTFVGYARYRGENFIGKKIYHYAGRANTLTDDNFNRLWIGYFMKTSWFDEELFWSFYEKIRQIYIQQKVFARRITEIVTDKTRAFFVQPSGVEAIKKIFNVKPDEEFISADSSESVKKMIESLKKAEGKKVFFILVNDFPAIFKELNEAGFTFAKDFLNAVEFLSDAEGVPLDSHKLVMSL